jgi:uncharacterized membrane protein
MTALVAMKAASAIATETKFLASCFFTFVIVLVLLLVIDLSAAAVEHDYPRSQTLFGNDNVPVTLLPELRNRISKTSAFPNRAWERGAIAKQIGA